MTLIEAWKKSNAGQWIKRENPILQIHRMGLLKDLLHNWEYRESDFLADDWEVVREKKSLVRDFYVNRGLTNEMLVTIPKEIPYNCYFKLIFEWEE